MTMKVLGSCKDELSGYCGVDLGRPSGSAIPSAVFHCKDISLNLPIFDTSVGLEAQDEPHLQVIPFPLFGHAGRLIVSATEEQSSVTLGNLSILPSRLSFESRYIHWRRRALYSAMRYRCKRLSHTGARMEFCGLYPVDGRDMACRVVTSIPKDIDSSFWSWDVYVGLERQSSAKPILLGERERHEDGIDYREIFMSFLIPRDARSVLIKASDSQEGHSDGFVCLTEEHIAATLGDWYDLTADARSSLDYQGWFMARRATGAKLDRQRDEHHEGGPKMSIVIPLYEPPLDFLQACITSVLLQTYPRWELVLVDTCSPESPAARYLASLDDPRMRIVKLDGNLGIAGNTNAGIRATTGDYIAFMDQDDILEPDALYEYARAVHDEPCSDLLYCDEDSFGDSLLGVFSPLLKPDFNPDLLYGHNYVIHLLMVSRWALERVELSADPLSGAQDYDLTLKVSQVARAITHIERVLYHWRQHAASTNDGNMSAKPYAEEAGRQALLNHFSRQGIEAQVSITDTPAVYKTTFMQECPSEKISIMITGAEGDAVERCIEAIEAKAGVSPYEILIPVSDAHDHALPSLRNGVVRTIACTSDSSDSLRNALAAKATGNLLLFIDSGSLITTEGFLDLLAGYFQRPEVGCVGPLMVGADGLIQHAGLAVSPEGRILSMNLHHTLATNKGYLGSSECGYDYPAVSSLCLMVRAETFRAFGGFPDNGTLGGLALCKALAEKGLHSVYCPHAKAVRTGMVPDPEAEWVAADMIRDGWGLLTGSCDKASAYFRL